LHQIDEYPAACVGWSQIRNGEPASGQLKTPRNSVFLYLTETLDNLESQRFIEPNTSLEIPARDADMQKIIDHFCSRCE
jgi:hypothetical protein